MVAVLFGWSKVREDEFGFAEGGKIMDINYGYHEFPPWAY